MPISFVKTYTKGNDLYKMKEKKKKQFWLLHIPNNIVANSNFFFFDHNLILSENMVYFWSLCHVWILWMVDTWTLLNLFAWFLAATRSLSLISVDNNVYQASQQLKYFEFFNWIRRAYILARVARTHTNTRTSRKSTKLVQSRNT